MIHTFYFSLFVLFHVGIVQTSGEESCYPRPVQNVTLYDNHILTFDPPPNEICDIIYYVILIEAQPDWEPHLFITDQTTMDAGHLPECTNVWFTITPITSENVEGPSFYYFTKTPAPPDINLTISSLRLSIVSGGIMLDWDLADELNNCAKQFRVVKYNEDDDDIYTTYAPFNSAFIFDLIPCTSYVLTVTPLYNLETEGRVSVMRYVVPSQKIDSPSLQEISLGTTTADLTWTLPGPTANRCPVTALIVDGSPYFNISYPVASQNQVNRIPIRVHLTSLQPDAMYMLRVSANNTSGFSDPFILGVQTSESV